MTTHRSSPKSAEDSMASHSPWSLLLEKFDSAEVTEALAALVDKSLVTLDTTANMRYRLLDTTRAYAWQKLAESDEHARIARRHAEYFVTVSSSLGRACH